MLVVKWMRGICKENETEELYISWSFSFSFHSLGPRPTKRIIRCFSFCFQSLVPSSRLSRTSNFVIRPRLLINYTAFVRSPAFHPLLPPSNGDATWERLVRSWHQCKAFMQGVIEQYGQRGGGVFKGAQLLRAWHHTTTYTCMTSHNYQHALTQWHS
jgi:hypothetical protein